MRSILLDKPEVLKLLLIFFLGIPAFIIFAFLLAGIWPWGADYYFHFYPLAEQWLDGQFTMYDGSGIRLFYPPWSLFVIIPIGLLPIEIAHGFLLASTLVLIIISIRLLQGVYSIPIYVVFLSLVNLHSFDLYIRGQIDAIILLGIAMGFWAIQHRKPMFLSIGFCLIVMKPPLNVLLIILMYLISIRKWSRRELLIVFSAPLFMVLISSILVGPRWPIDFINNVDAPIDYLSISIWEGATWLGIPQWIIVITAILSIWYILRLTWKKGITTRSLSIGLATTFVFTLYANGDHYVLLIPAFIFVIENNLFLGLLAYFFTWTPLLRLQWGPDAGSIDILYPIILLLASYVITEPETMLNNNNKNLGFGG